MKPANTQKGNGRSEEKHLRFFRSFCILPAVFRPCMIPTFLCPAMTERDVFKIICKPLLEDEVLSRIALRW